MIEIACVVLTAAACYFSFGLGHAWWLAWLAPVPVLWLAFGETKPWKAFLAAWAGFALGMMSLARAYVGVFPASVLAFEFLAPSLLFAVCAIGSRRVARRFGAVSAMVAFAALWTGLDLLLSFDPAVGSMLSPAGTQVAAPLLIQSAALVGFVGVTFLLGIVAGGLALSLRTGKAAPVLISAALFAANAAYGYWRSSHPAAATARVALVNSNTYGYWAASVHEHQPPASIQAEALRIIDAYAAQIDNLRGRHVRLVVLPENIAQIGRAWHAQAWAELAAAADATGATIIGGFNEVLGGFRRNVALAFVPGAAQPIAYEKRRLVPAVESGFFVPGAGPQVLPGGAGIEICLDMDSPEMIRRDEVTTRPELLAVPASEIGTHGDWLNPGPAADDWFHARDAVLRSVENGIPMARSAGRGLLTSSDRYGRIIAQASTRAGFTTLVGELPLSGRGGATLYDRIGDTFGWLCLVLGIGMVGAAWLGRSSAAESWESHRGYG